MSIRTILPAALVAASQIQGALAWGDMAHEATAYIAQAFVSTSTKEYLQRIMGDNTTSYLANYVTWADSYRYTSAGSFSYPYHFIDANDNPPSSCSVDYARDCGSSGCSVSAVANYTNALLSSKTSSSGQFEALKFLIHFVGDMHQPLHDENLDVGGNDISVTFSGTKTNLHHIWDTNMPEKDAGGYTLATARSFANTLITALNSGAYASQKAGWISGMDITNPQATAMTWASDANSYVCSIVLKDGITYLEKTDLSGSYYTAAKPVFEELIARAGYRMAAWLNLIAEKAPK